MGVLKVKVVNLENLPDKDMMGKTDPYVIIEIEKDGWISDDVVAKAETSHKVDTCNPEFNEEFSFTIPTLDKFNLVIKVMDDDMLGDEAVGHRVEIDLEKQGLQPGVPKEIKMKVHNRLLSKDAFCNLIVTWD